MGKSFYLSAIRVGHRRRNSDRQGSVGFRPQLRAAKVGVHRGARAGAVFVNDAIIELADTDLCALAILGTAEIAGDAEKECKDPRAAVSKLIWLLFARLCSG
jgi:hypothetical protein